MVFPFPERVLPRELIIEKKLLDGLEDTQASGIEIPPNLVANLERQWRAHINKPIENADPATRGRSALEGERIEQRSYRRKRDLRLKLISLEISGGVCAVCDTDYSKVLGGKGKRVLQVHHKKQLSQMDVPKLNTPDDLAVVCANCHALIHLNPKEALKIKALRLMLSKAT